MPLRPEDAPEAAAGSISSENLFPPSESPVRQKPKRLGSICFAIFTLGVGLFLVIFPWMANWNLNYLQGMVPAFRNVWKEFYVRGAVTALGLVNLYVAGLEVSRLLKRS